MHDRNDISVNYELKEYGDEILIAGNHLVKSIVRKKVVRTLHVPKIMVVQAVSGCAFVAHLLAILPHYVGRAKKGLVRSIDVKSQYYKQLNTLQALSKAE